MEAPEKLYLPKRNKLPLEVVRGGEWYETNPQCMYGSVEYIRKDAFIEKACGWIKNFNDFHNIMRYSDCCEVPLEQIIENFEEYLKK